jgi:hypothetical protein
MTMLVLRVERHVDTVRVEHLSRRIRLALYTSGIPRRRVV